MGKAIKSGWSEADIPHGLDGKVALITGANSGLGYHASRMLAARGVHVLMACRNQAKATEASDRIKALHPQAKLTLINLDLADLDSVKQIREQLQKNNISQIDILLNNAGIMAPPKRATTRQGFELQFGTNHLAHFALTTHVFPLLQTNARVVNVSSIGNQRNDVNWDDIQWEQNYSPFGAYAQSKTANLLFTYELNRRLSAMKSDIVTVATHPGIAQTNLVEGSTFDTWWWKPMIFIITLSSRFLKVGMRLQSGEMGTLPLVYACTDTVTPGAFYGPEHRSHGHPQLVNEHAADYSNSPEGAKRLWEISEKLTGLKFLAS